MEQMQMAFDYAALDSETRIVVQQRTTEVREAIRHLAGLVRQTAETVWVLGAKLADVRDRLAPSGRFAVWCESELPGVSRGTIYNALNVYTAFPELPSAGGDFDIPLKALYLLAAPSTPCEARDEAIARAQSGESITHTVVQEIRRAHQLPLAALTNDQFTVVPSVVFRRYTAPVRESSDEAALVQSLAAHLVAQGDQVVLQVGCAVGVADLVTDDAVYEVKYWLTREAFMLALGQVLLYRQAISPSMRAVIVGFAVANISLADLVCYAEQLGVETWICNN